MLKRVADAKQAREQAIRARAVADAAPGATKKRKGDQGQATARTTQEEAETAKRAAEEQAQRAADQEKARREREAASGAAGSTAGGAAAEPVPKGPDDPMGLGG